MPPHDLGLLACLDALAELAADRHGLPCSPAAAWPPPSPGSPPTPPGSARPGLHHPRVRITQRDAVELLRRSPRASACRGSAATGAREATSLRHAWAQIDEARGPACPLPGASKSR